MDRQEQVSGTTRSAASSPTDLDPTRTALIVVDMQRCFTQASFPFTELFEKLSPGIGAGYLTRVRESVVPNIRRLLACVRQTASPIIFTAVGSEAGDGSELPCWLRSIDELGLRTLGCRVYPHVSDISWQIDAALEPRSNELVLNKLSAGAFATTDLERRLRRERVESVMVTGVTTDVCVSTTAREAADRDFRVVVVSDACTTLSVEQHRANLETLQVFGRVRTTTEVIDEMRAAVRAV